MSANLSATIYMENDGQGGTIPVVVYSKATTYETKQGGNRSWKTNNFFGITQSSSDSYLTYNRLNSYITFEDNTAWSVWSSDPTIDTTQITGVSGWWQSIFLIVDTTIVSDMLDTFMANSNYIIDKNVFIANLNRNLHLSNPSNPVVSLDSTTTSLSNFNLSSFIPAALIETLPLDVNSTSYFDRGILTKVIGVNLYTGLPNSVRVHWDWTDTRDVIEEDVLVTSLAFGAAGVVGWISNLFRGGISAGMIAATTGGTAVVGTQLTEEGESILPKLESVIVSEADSIPSFLTSQQIQSIQVNVNALAPRFYTLTIAQQNSLIMQQLALKLHGISTVINVVVQKMPDSFIVEYDPNAALPSPLIQVLFRWDQYGMALQNLQFQLSNGGNTTITPPQ